MPVLLVVWWSVLGLVVGIVLARRIWRERHPIKEFLRANGNGYANSLCLGCSWRQGLVLHPKHFPNCPWEALRLAVATSNGEESTDA